MERTMNMPKPEEINYYPQLERIRDFLESNRDFPKFPKFPLNWCGHTSYLVRRLIGLPVLRGFYVDSASERKTVHAWNHDPSLEAYIDLTQDQFSNKNPRVAILPSSTSILQRFEPADFEDEPDFITKSLDILERQYRKTHLPRANH